MSLHPNFACPCLKCRDMAAVEIERLTKENRDLRSMVAQYELLVIPDRGGKVEDGSA